MSGDKRCPFGPYFSSAQLDVLELGAGVGGICGSVLGPHSKRYVCSDQKLLLKLLRVNLEQNAPQTDIGVVELDWEYLPQGLENYYTATEPGNTPDLVLACDTIYNEYLIPFFLRALDSVMSHQTVCIVAVQMRDDITLEAFVSQTVEMEFDLYTVRQEDLSDQLSRGYVVYGITRSQS
ncbi:Ribosomal protein lysine methyltransferase [Yamadazyma tenuis]|uniref:Ribosomal protein lysine methyltransferase n=1 Tax=Candida tenuis TaxID=2315449 RepID=UPI002798CFE4|nr:Ribosomal protein lysine methyltransferase [Yamadazyma tenuis]